MGRDTDQEPLARDPHDADRCLGADVAAPDDVHAVGCRERLARLGVNSVHAGGRRA